MTSPSPSPRWRDSSFFVTCFTRHNADQRIITIFNMTANQPMHSISLNTAAVLTGRSIRTWQRRIEEGLVPRLSDARERALVPFDAVRPALAVALDDEDVQTLVRADQGNTAAQAEIGALFALAALDSRTSDSLGGGGRHHTCASLSYAGCGTRRGGRHALAWHVARRRTG